MIDRHQLLALSIQQPWADHLMLASGPSDKPVENREWPTKYRGPLLIHAPAKLDRDAPPSRRHGPTPRSCILGMMMLTDCIGTSEALRRFPKAEEWIYGTWCFVLERPREMAHHIPCRGRLGLFRPELEPNDQDEVRRFVQRYIEEQR